MNKEPENYDSPWKEIVEVFFRQFIAFFFPHADTEIDWNRGYEFLDKEFQQVIHDAQLGRRLVDKLVKVWLKAGDEAWVLIHIEVQAQKETDFAQRMFLYNTLIFQRYQRRVASLAILGDEHPEWNPNFFGYNLFGCEIRFRFPTVKLVEYREDWERLENDPNPFATVVMVHLKTLETKKDESIRLHWKYNITRGLYERRMEKEVIIRLFRFIDVIMRLPKELENQFNRQLKEYEEVKTMPYLTPMEELAIEKGIEQGIEKGIEQGIEQGIEKGTIQTSWESILDILESRFGDIPSSLIPMIHEITNVSTLKMLRKKSLTVGSLDEFKQIVMEDAKS